MARYACVLLAVCLAVAPHAGAQPSERPAEAAAPSKPGPAQPERPGEAPPSGSRPPPEYYVDAPTDESPDTAADAPPAPAAPPVAAGVYEPPPPGQGYGPQFVYEPPPPPKPRHVAPKYSFWVGPRIGWFVPFGNLWYRCNPGSPGNCSSYTSNAWNDYASSAPMFEIDVGARLGRNYNVFALWERANLGAGDNESYENARGGLDHASTDYFAVGLRVSSDADKIGFLTEITLGARRFRAVYEDGSEFQLSEDIPLEARIGLGADIRLSPLFSLSPLLTLGVGRFDNIEAVDRDGNRSDQLSDLDELGSHGWLTLQIGGHFDIAGAK
jgi:hypothetical protein